MDSARARVVAALFASAVVASLALSLGRVVPFPMRAFLFDYHAFACAGAIARTPGDPYRAEPLRTCEHRAAPFRKDLARLAVPAPLPGYALAPFAILGRLPGWLGGGLWLALSLLGAAVAGRALIRLSRLPPAVVWSALALPMLTSLVLGQLVPFALGALCLAAVALERGRFGLAAGAVWCAMIEPHVALPAVVALAIFVPRARVAVGIGAAAAALLSLALLGLGTNLEYLLHVLPAHAASELANEEQYSLAYLLHRLGAGDGLALGIADVWYVVAIALGLWLAERLVHRGAPRALYVLLPAGVATIGGPFVHIAQLACALPAALVLAGRVAPRARAPALAVVMLAVPWGAFGSLLAGAPLVAVAVAVLVAELLRARPLVAAVAGLGAAAFVVALALHLTPRPDAAAALAAVKGGGLLAEAAWKAYIANGFHANAALFGWAKLPTLVGLGLMLGTALVAALGTPSLQAGRGLGRQ
jgi:hypothetical protein